MESHVTLGNTDFWLGNLVEARDHLQAVIGLYNPAEHDVHLHMFGQDARVTARTYGSWATWMLGYPDQALAHAHEAMRIAHERNNLYLVVTAQQIEAWVNSLRGETAVVLEISGSMIEICQKENFPVFLAIGLMLHGWGLAQMGEVEIGVGEIQQGLQIWNVLGSQLTTAPYNWLADVFIQAERWQEALDAAEAGLRDAQHHHEDVFLSELLRFKALALFGLNRSEEAEGLLLKAYQTAEQQQAKSYQLRAALSLFSHTENPLNRKRLQEVYDWFTEGHQTLDLERARHALT
jgi:predicted ATPase